MKFIRFLPIFFLLSVVLIFFKPFIAEGKLPIPADTIIGLYHPFRDLYPKDMPFKNSLITDPVRQQYPWRELTIDSIKKGELPLWNSYSMAGYPLLGNLQSAVFYPLNIIFLLLPFSLAWGLLIFLQPLLAGIFIYLYLNNLRLNKWASLFGAITFAFGGFSIAWMEWGTILHVGLWLPLILLSIDKIQKSKLFWPIIFISSLVSSFFAGHLQTFFYVFVISLVYLMIRWWQCGKNKKTLLLFVICYLLFAAFTAVQWLPTLQLIGESARSIDQVDWQREGWFIPWQNLVQFVAPDFFGNPTTGNYWGVWNYGEFIGYIGILPLLMVIFALVSRKDKKTFFFGSMLLFSLIFALPTFLAKIPYQFNIPFLSTAQPTRLLFITDFSLAILAALGFDYFTRRKNQVFYPVIMVGFILITLWLIILKDNILVARNNLILPTALFAVSAGLIFITGRFIKKKNLTLIMYIIIAGVTAFDLIRFGWKFTPFTSKEYLFPSTSVISFLQKQEGQFRIMAVDDRIFPPNFSIVYRLQTVGGYDPLYLSRYGELIAASERGQPNINPPFGFNRIITPKNFDSKLIDLLGVKYVLSLADLTSAKLTKVFQEGQTRVYENKNAIPRSFFAENIVALDKKERVIESMFSDDVDLRKTAFVEEYRGVVSNTPLGCANCKVKIIDYSENRITIETDNLDNGLLVLTDSFYPSWKARIDGVQTEIYRTDYNFRGIVVPKGKHTISFSINLL